MDEGERWLAALSLDERRELLEVDDRHGWMSLAPSWARYRLVTRIRSIAEHARTPDVADPLNNTRATLARGGERMLIAPNRVASTCRVSRHGP